MTATEIFALRFANSGAPAGSEFQVNSFTCGLQYSAAVSLTAAGDHVLTWA